MKKLDIIHYHLKPGGVTTIINSQLESLLDTDDFEIRVICGDSLIPASISKMNVEIIQDNAFNYTDFEENDPAVIEEIMLHTRATAQKLFSKERIIHFHNLGLGKSPYWCIVMHELALEGYKIINHIHDFAEDRPENHHFLKRIIQEHYKLNLREVLYPHLANYFYTALSKHDFERIKQQGVSEKNITLLPNPINIDHIKESASESTRQQIYQELQLDPAKKLVTYPVRAIRRKNIGELILIAHLFRKTAHFAITLPPENPVEIKHYNRWKKFCSDHNIPVIFEAGLKTDYINLITSSDFCITTSTREGFGMTYLEPWMLSTPVMGRNLKNITKDFIREGIIFPGLYNFVRVPHKGDLVDFGMMKPEKQQDIILNLLNDDMLENIVYVSNSHLKKMFYPIKQNIISENQEIIKNKFSLVAYGNKLRKLYQTITG